MKLYIKNMVCSRCRMLVKSELEKLGLQLLSVDLGVIDTLEPVTEQQKHDIAATLKVFGFELIDDKKSKAIEKIKTLIIDLVHHKNNELNVNLSEYISNHLLQDYAMLSNLFSEVEGITIEKYFILQKIERVKELLMYDEMSLSEISFLLHYSSVAYLSNQFKKITGFSPSHYKQLKDKKRMQIEDL
ncbi:helix-turn-helix domain-containing protein [Confluentibacter flavum]|uniref:AraC family transcriptional regulator n=1 Tax=Confluentibacter flavum TaxID=1909700 RepID=A0A2N3HML1_9FLAO|nr:AraC family transcriptional regulator [Confluentibacter flavum]PKQ46142.1 AraC family transcriptional regulator [Confluentibacter flavum]